MYKKVLLLNSPSDNRFFISVQPPLGILYIASVLRRNNIDVFVGDLNIEKQWLKKLIFLLQEYNPSIVGISSNFSNVQQTLKIAGQIKLVNRNIVTVVGGPHPTIAPSEYYNCNIDYIVPFEGEKVMLNLVLSDDAEKVDGLISVKEKNSGIINNGLTKNRIDNLDDLPFPAYDLINVSNYYINFRSYKKRPLASMITSRGCPQNCIFCSQGVSGKSWRARSAVNVVEEITWLKDKIGIKEISIEDDNFTFDIERVYRICELIGSKNLKIVWQLANGIRADKVTKDLLKEIKKAGCWKIAIAPEVGDEESLRKIKKGIKLDQFLKVAQWAKEIGIVYYGFFLMGFPFQNKKSMEKIISFAIKLDPLLMDLSKVIPFPGTELMDLFSDKDRYKNNISYYYLSDNELLEKMYKKAYFKFYFRLTKMIEIIKIIGAMQLISLLIFGFRTLFFKKKNNYRSDKLGPRDIYNIGYVNALK